MKHTAINKQRRRKLFLSLLVGVAALAAASLPASAQQQKRPNVVMLMTDDTGWNDFGAYSGGGAALGHPTPNIDRIAKEGATFTNWYGALATIQILCSNSTMTSAGSWTRSVRKRPTQ